MLNLLNRLNEWMNESRRQFSLSIGLLILRVSCGLMMIQGHGWSKLMNFGEKAATFSNPVGLGSYLSFSLVVFAEFFCAVAIILGLATRFVAIPIIITMSVVVFIVHSDDPWRRSELAALYIVPFLMLVFSGAGDFSLDRLIRKWIEKSSN